MNLTTEQKLALAGFKNRNGRTWKSKLRDIWMTGNYNYSVDDSATLQQLRNSEHFGPRGLIAVRGKDLAFNACTIVRTFIRKHYTLTFNSDDLQPAGPDTVHTEACNIPLFADAERASGICRTCHKGWEVEGNQFANNAERERATAGLVTA